MSVKEIGNELICNIKVNIQKASFLHRSFDILLVLGEPLHG